jgi:uncharacterized protein YjdB
MCAWSVNDKVEDWSIFTNNLDGLTCVGNFYKSKLITWPTPIVVKIYPTSVAISTSSVTIPSIGGTTQLLKSFLPANTSETNATWTSSNQEIAVVNSSGVVTGIAAGTVTITVTSKDKDGKNISAISTVRVNNLVNLALNKPVTVSSIEAGATVSVAGSNAVDGNITTRWSSEATDPQILQVDLGASYALSNVAINWEAPSAKDYTIQISSNGSSWTTVATQSNMAAGARADNLSISGTCRYIKIDCTKRTSIYVFSIYEFVVYGTPGAPVRPTNVSVSPATASVSVGSNTTFYATVLPANATDSTVSWSSSNAAVATVNAAGVVTGLAEGSAIITATTTDGALKATSTVTVSNVSCTGVTLSPVTSSVIKGTTIPLIATVIPSNASNKNVNYILSNTAIATVSTAGVVTAVGTGSATITATTIEGGCYATSVVNVTNAPAFSVKIEAESYALKSAAPVSENCSEGGLNMGWFGTGDWMKYAVNIPSTGVYTVNFRVSSPNSNAQLRLDANAGAIVFGSAAIPNTGGWQNWQTVTTQMTLNGGVYDLGINALVGGFNINWIEIGGGSVAPVNVTGIDFAATTSVGIGATSTLSPTISPNNAVNKNVNWTSSNAAVATVSANGILAGVASGSANITATTVDGGFKAICAVTVSSSNCPTWLANTNYAIGTVVVFNNQNYTSNNAWNGTAGDPFEATHSQSGWGWVIGGTCSSTLENSNTTKTANVLASPDGKKVALSVYPNPVKNGIVTIFGSGFENHENVSISIFNIIGQLVYSRECATIEAGELNLLIAITENMKAGTYFVKIQGSIATNTKLIIN